MKMLEVIKSNIGIMTLDESSLFIAEMANFLADTTELPANIVLWTEPQPGELPHTKYRIKVYKDRVHSATFSIGQAPEVLWEVRNPKFRLDGREKTAVSEVISKFSSLFVQYVDGMLTTNEIKYEMKRIHGMQ